MDYTFVVNVLVFGAGLCCGGAAVRLLDLSTAGRAQRAQETATEARRRETLEALREAAFRPVERPAAPPQPNWDDSFYGRDDVERQISEHMERARPSAAGLHYGYGPMG